MTLKLREKIMSLSGDSFTIESLPAQNPDAPQPYLKCEGKVATIHARKIITDASTGQELFHIKQVLLRLLKSWDIVKPGSDEPIAHVKSHFTVFSGAKMTISFKNLADGSGNDVEIALEGSFWDRNAKMTCNGQPVASIDRKFLNARQLVFDQQTYFLTVAPGVDAALMAAICICLDEKAAENNG